MARIKHIAIRTNDVEKTASFYREAFGLEDAGRGINGVYLSDGHINLAILTVKGSGRAGIDHLGFEVDHLDDAIATAERVGARRLTTAPPPAPTNPSDPQSYFEIKLAGPDGQEIDVSETGWAGAPRGE